MLLFADPREAEERCGCAEIIRMVRGLAGAPRVSVREIEPRRQAEDARRVGVRTSPTVLILDAAGNERARFEGESSATVASLRSALAELQRSSERASEARGP